MGQGFLHDVGLASFVTGVLSIMVVVIAQFDEFRWGRKWQARREDRNRRKALIAEFYANRPTKPLYDLVPAMALAEAVSDRATRFERRAQKLDDPSFPNRHAAEGLARQWLATVGAFAQAAGHERVPLRSFLATYHLGIMREGTIAVPIAARLLASDDLSGDEREHLFWGMALLDLAGDYNSIARQQRAPVYFEERQHQPLVGPVRVPPSRVTRPLRDIRDVSSLNFRLRRWRYQRSRRWLHRVARRLSVQPT